MIINCTIDELKAYLQEQLTPKRYIHSLGVADCARNMANSLNYDGDFAYVAGLLHDCGRAMSDEQLIQFAETENISIGVVEMLQPVLLHAPCGRAIAKKYFGVTNEDILKSIANHTTGAPCMGILEKIIYVADMIEPERKFDGVKRLRKQAQRSLDAALIAAYDVSIKYVVKNGKMLHPDTIAARNELLMLRGECYDGETT